MNKFLLKFETSNKKIYEIEAIQDNVVYTKEADGHLLRLYYLLI